LHRRADSVKYAYTSDNQREGAMIRLMIVDDHELFRVGLAQLLGSRIDIQVVAIATNGREAMDLMAENSVDVALIDLTLPDMSGIDVMARLLARCPDAKVLIVSACPEEQFAFSVLKAGAMGFVPKDAPAPQIVTAILAAAQGRRFVSPKMADKLARGVGANAKGDEPAHSLLSQREFQIFFRIASGKSVSEIAKELFLSVKTVSTYRARILEKMEFTSNANLTYYAVKNQLIA